MNKQNPIDTAFREARDEFVSQWGVIGNAWGINRTMAQIHALLITSPSALSTDDIMEDLKIDGTAMREHEDRGVECQLVRVDPDLRLHPPVRPVLGARDVSDRQQAADRSMVLSIQPQLSQQG